jgi:hypothetical protein
MVVIPHHTRKLRGLSTVNHFADHSGARKVGPILTQPARALKGCPGTPWRRARGSFVHPAHHARNFPWIEPPAY